MLDESKTDIIQEIKRMDLKKTAAALGENLDLEDSD